MRGRQGGGRESLTHHVNSQLTLSNLHSTCHALDSLGENLTSESSWVRWWKEASCSRLSASTTTKLPVEGERGIMLMLKYSVSQWTAVLRHNRND